MSSKHTLFRIFYRLGFTPWDGHPLAQSLRNLIEGTDALPAGSALELGCGTGDCSIYLAQHGWQVTAVDYVKQALEKPAPRRKPPAPSSTSPAPTSPA
jgi:2-polyprenyl-3-methyl-5-hydroxy-6-metoxy-1,4-benzoquinol methylase